MKFYFSIRKQIQLNNKMYISIFQNLEHLYEVKINNVHLPSS